MTCQMQTLLASTLQYVNRNQLSDVSLTHRVFYRPSCLTNTWRARCTALVKPQLIRPVQHHSQLSKIFQTRFQYYYSQGLALQTPVGLHVHAVNDLHRCWTAACAKLTIAVHWPVWQLTAQKMQNATRFHW